MARRRWKRRKVLVGAIIVALSIGIVFASLSYLQHPVNNTHGSIQTSITHNVPSGNQSYPGYFDVRIPNVTLSESFWIRVTVVGGTASFCALDYQTYFSWELPYKFHPTPNSFPAQACILQTGQVTLTTLQFSITPGTWAIVALNTAPYNVTASFYPA